MLRVGLTGSIACGKSFIAQLFSVYGVRIVDSDLIAREVVLPGSPVLAQIAERFGQEMLLADGSLNRPALRELVFSNSAALQSLNAIMHPAIRARTEELVECCRQGQPFPRAYSAICAQSHAYKAKGRALAPVNPLYRTPSATGTTSNASTTAPQNTGEHKDATASPDAVSPQATTASSTEAAQVIDETQTAAWQQALQEPLAPELILSRSAPCPYILMDIPLLFENKLMSMVDRILVITCSEDTQLKRLMMRDHSSEAAARQIMAKQIPPSVKAAQADDVLSTEMSSLTDKRLAVLKLHRLYIELAQKG